MKKWIQGIVVLAIGLSSLHAEWDQNINVSGSGWLQDLRLARVIRQFVSSTEDEQLALDSTIEDGFVLLQSRLSQQGFLEPRIVAVLREPGGAEFRLEWNEELVVPELDEELFVSLRFEVERGIRFFFERVVFSGLNVVPEKEARSFFFPSSTFFDPKSLRAYSDRAVRRGMSNLRTQYQSLGYREVVIRERESQIDVSSGEVITFIDVEEGPLYLVEDLDLVFGENADPSDFGNIDLNSLRAELVNSDQDQVAFSPEWERTKSLVVRNQFYRRGYPDATLQVVANELQRDVNNETVLLSLTATVVPGPFVQVGPVTFEGLEHTQTATIKRQQVFEAGELLSRLDVEQTRRNISSLGIFQTNRAIIESPDPPLISETGAEIRPVRLVFQEGERQNVYIRGGWGSYEQLRLGLELEQKNLFGLGHRFDTFGRYSTKSFNAEALYSIPEFGGWPIRFSTKAEWLNREEVSFVRQELSLESGVDYFHRPWDTRFRTSYKLERLESRDIDRGATEFLVEDDTRSASIEFTAIRDLRDNPILPKSGARYRANVEVADKALGSSTDYQRVELTYSYHWPFMEGWWFNVGLRHGAVLSLGGTDADVPFNKRFFPGGENTIRGYQEGRASFTDDRGIYIGSAVVSLANFELERALLPDLTFVLFSDNMYHGVSVSDYPGTEFLSSAGLGIRYNSPLGPIRAEYGYNLNPRPFDDEGAFHFSLGFPF